MANVTGPASSTDTAIARWNGTSGTEIQDSVVLVDSSGNVSGMNSISSDGGAFTSDGSGNVYATSFNGSFNGSSTTQPLGDNSTKVATTAFATYSVSSAVNGVDPYLGARVSTLGVADLDVTYSNGSGGVGATLTNAGTQQALVIDGVSLNTNDVVLVASQNINPYQNGVYLVATVGDGSTNWVLTRATYYDTPSDMNNLGYIVAYEGDENAWTASQQTATITTIGTDGLTFSTYSVPASGSLPRTVRENNIIVGIGNGLGYDRPMAGDVTISYNSGTQTADTAIKSSVALAGSPTTTTQSSSDNSTNIATTAFVQTVVGAITAGLDSRPSCRVATTAALTATYSNGSSGVGATLTNSATQAAIAIDGVSLSSGDRVLVKNQATAAQNGIYTVTTVGSGSTNWVLTRATDFNTASGTGVVEGAFTVIEEGTTQFGTLWIETGEGPFTIGTTAITFTQLQVTNVNLTNGDILVGNASNIAAAVSMSGDVTIDDTGATSIKSSVALAGSPTTTTQTAGDDSTKIATTAYVDAAVTAGAGATPVVGSTRNAKMSVTTASATATFTADQIVVETALNGAALTLSSYSQSVNLGTTGAGGMDTGSAPNNGWVSLYAIAKADGTKNILACNETTSNAEIYAGANMPSGYTYSALIAVRPTNGSGQFTTGYIIGRTFWHGTPVNVLNVSSGSSPTTYTSVTLTSAVPAKAHGLFGTVGPKTNNYSAWQLSTNSSGLIQQTLMLSPVSGAPTVDGFYDTTETFQFPLPTSQTMYYKMQATTNDARMSINGYTF
jgi:hypothetical protein